MTPTPPSHAFVDGIHFAVTIGAALAVVAAVVVLRYLPHQAHHESAGEAAEHVAELAVGGAPPSFDESEPADAGYRSARAVGGRGPTADAT